MYFSIAMIIFAISNDGGTFFHDINSTISQHFLLLLEKLPHPWSAINDEYREFFILFCLFAAFCDILYHQVVKYEMNFFHFGPLADSFHIDLDFGTPDRCVL